MNVFLRELRANRKALIIWLVGILFLVISGMGKFESYSKTGASINQIWEDMPKAFKAFIGVGSLDMTTPIGYYGMLYLFILVTLFIHAAILGASIIAKEERDKTAEFLLAKPVSRQQIITAKLSAALINVLIVNIFSFVISTSSLQALAKKPIDMGIMLLLNVAMLIGQLLFLFLGAALAAIFKKPKAASSVCVSILLATYLLSSMIDLSDKLNTLKYLTPFQYFKAENLIKNQSIEPVYLILSVLIIVVCIPVTYIFYKKRDMNI